MSPGPAGNGDGGAAIRPAGGDDVGAIRRVAEAAYMRYVPRIGRKPAPMIADFAAHVAEGEAWVAEAAGDIAGFIVTFPDEGGQFVENVAVSPDHAGMGLGRMLMAFADAEAVRNGCARVFLYTNVRMTENLEFYGRLGFRVTHFVRERGFQRVYLAKEVTAP